MTQWSLLVIHLPTRLPWENGCAVPNPAYYICYVELPLKGVSKTPAWYVSYAMLMRPSKAETAVHGC